MAFEMEHWQMVKQYLDHSEEYQNKGSMDLALLSIRMAVRHLYQSLPQPTTAPQQTTAPTREDLSDAALDNNNE